MGFFTPNSGKYKSKRSFTHRLWGAKRRFNSNQRRYLKKNAYPMYATGGGTANRLQKRRFFGRLSRSTSDPFPRSAVRRLRRSSML